MKNASIIVGRKGTVGSLYWEDDPFYPIDTVFYIKPEKIPLSYCLYLLESLDLDKMNTDAAVPGLNRNNVYRLLALLSSNEIIELFDNKVSVLKSKIYEIKKEIKTLQKTRDTLLPKLLSGELDVSELEIK